jgi:hypothetical protein
LDVRAACFEARLWLAPQHEGGRSSPRHLGDATHPTSPILRCFREAEASKDA